MPYQLNSQAYAWIGAPDYIIEWIDNGIRIPFKLQPNKCFYANCIDTVKRKEFVTKQITKLIQQKSLKQVNFKPHCLSSTVCAEEKWKTAFSGGL